MGRPTDPRFRSASAALSMQATGLISVCPKKVAMGTPGRTRLIFSSTCIGVVAAPHEARRNRS